MLHGTLGKKSNDFQNQAHPKLTKKELMYNRTENTAIYLTKTIGLIPHHIHVSLKL